ncbi:hypothetical protein BV20DRAFT_960758 [Pilatotrama ljubarskyi]|nr:hypothetical protein BV20DRAFT_960758 [Pilatotrama ljubarskyi]
MPSVLDLPYDVLREIFSRLSAVEVLHFLCISRKLYYPLIDDDSTWYIFCARYGIKDTSTFRRRSFRTIYGRLLHRYGPLLGLWCSDYPCHGNIIEFRIVPDNWLRRGEPIIIGEVWEFDTNKSKAPRPYQPTYTEFMQIGFVPWKKSTPATANDVHISWHLRSERDLGFLVHNGLPPPWVRMDGDGRLATPSLKVIAPTSLTFEVEAQYNERLVQPEMLASAPWYDPDRGVPRLPQERGPPVVEQTRYSWIYSPPITYVHGAQKPASIAFLPPPPRQESDVRIPIHNPRLPHTRDFSDLVPCYFPLRYPTQEGDDPASPDWRPESLVGLWLGDYGPHGTECLYLEHDAAESALRAWKIIGDVHVPRGACSWDADLRVPLSNLSPKRAYGGLGTLAQRGFTFSEKRPVRVIISGRDEITVSWDLTYDTKFIRYRQTRERI